jgi:hypothetical protein
MLPRNYTDYNIEKITRKTLKILRQLGTACFNYRQSKLNNFCLFSLVIYAVKLSKTKISASKSCFNWSIQNKLETLVHSLDSKLYILTINSQLLIFEHVVLYKQFSLRVKLRPYVHCGRAWQVQSFNYGSEHE